MAIHEELQMALRGNATVHLRKHGYHLVVVFAESAAGFRHIGQARAH